MIASSKVIFIINYYSSTIMIVKLSIANVIKKILLVLLFLVNFKKNEN